MFFNQPSKFKHPIKLYFSLQFQNIMKAYYIPLILSIVMLLSMNLIAQNISEDWVNENCPPNNTYYVNCDNVISGGYSTRGIVEGNGAVLSGSNVTLNSADWITLKEGFEAKEGSEFEAVISTCTPQTGINSRITHFELHVDQADNDSFPNIEPVYTYGFVLPVIDTNLQVDTTKTPSYTPDIDNRYFTSLFGPRFAYRETSNTKFFDFHRGEDIVNGSSNHHPDITCMCDGTIEEVVDGTDPAMEATEEGRYVKVKCNSSFAANASWGNIYTAYRHLQSVANNPATGSKWLAGQPVTKGAVLGVMGSSGVTSFNHLHLSVQRKHGDEFVNVSAMRIFDPSSSKPYFPKHLQAQVNPTSSNNGATIYQLGYWPNSALFRVAIPYTQANIRYVKVELVGGGYSRIYDFEEVSRIADLQTTYANESVCLDNNEFVPDLALFAYSFNRASSARYHYRTSMFCMPFDYPASLQRALGQSCPIPANPAFFGEGDTPLYVLDVLARNLPTGYNIADLKISVLDIYGKGMSANAHSVGYAPFPEPTNTPGACTINSLPPISPLIGLPSNKDENPNPSSKTLLKEMGKSKLSIYPNPTASNELFLLMTAFQSEMMEIEIFNLAGKEVVIDKAWQDSEGRYKMDIGKLAPGAYLIQVKSEQGNTAGLFIKQ
jgi:murein DD-endopeptidase MepM/ murein hydrolase activator NlpD